jgi:Transposase zinc-binding domain
MNIVRCPGPRAAQVSSLLVPTAKVVQESSLEDGCRKAKPLPLRYHYDTFVSGYQTRYRETHGRLRTEAENAFLNFRRCGDPNFGVTLFRCDTCDVKLGVPFTCKARICPSCLSRKAETRASHLSEVLPQVEHRHIVFGLPKKMGLRQRIQEDPKLLRKVTRLVMVATKT